MQTDALLDHAARLWPLAKARALKQRVLTHADAAGALKVGLLDVAQAVWPMHTWCWARGLPPLNAIVVSKGKAIDRDGPFSSPDYDVMHEALGRSVYGLEVVWGYPWAKVQDPSADELAWALRLRAEHHVLVSRFRFTDLELEQRERDEARAFKRPPPPGFSSWQAVVDARGLAVQELGALGIRSKDLRPPGTSPYPPPPPASGRFEH